MNGASGSASLISIVLYLVFFIAIMYLLIFLPQKRREKKSKELVESAQVGNMITTIGGVSGKIINIKDDEVTVETSVMKTQIVFKKWAIKEVQKPIEA